MIQVNYKFCITVNGHRALAHNLLIWPLCKIRQNFETLPISKLGLVVKFARGLKRALGL